MPFDATKIAVGSVSLVSGDVPIQWVYKTTDTLATVLVSGYFNSFSSQFNIDDIVWVAATDVKDFIRVVAITPAVTTVQVITGGAAGEWVRVIGPPDYVIPVNVTDEVGATGQRIVKGWYTDLDSNTVTINGQLGVGTSFISSASIYAYTNTTTKTALHVQTENSSNTADTVIIESNGQGRVVDIDSNHTTTTTEGIKYAYAGLGKGIDVTTQNVLNANPSVHLTQAGTGAVLKLDTTDTTTATAGVQYNYAGVGAAVTINAQNASNLNPAVDITHNGGGSAVQIQTATATTDFSITHSSADASGTTLRLGKTRGTIGTPTEPLSGDVLVAIHGTGVRSTNTVDGGTIDFKATENWTLGAGTEMNFSTTPNGSLFPIIRMKLSNEGNFGVGILPDFGGGAQVIGLVNAITAPTINPSGGGVLYAEGGALKWRGSAGTITIIAAA